MDGPTGRLSSDTAERDSGAVQFGARSSCEVWYGERARKMIFSPERTRDKRYDDIPGALLALALSSVPA